MGRDTFRIISERIEVAVRNMKQTKENKKEILATIYKIGGRVHADTSDGCNPLELLGFLLPFTKVLYKSIYKEISDTFER